MQVVRPWHAGLLGVALLHSVAAIDRRGEARAAPAKAPAPAPPGSPCGLARPAFCEDFERPAPGGRAGPLDEKIWSFARYGHQSRQFFVRTPASTKSRFHQKVVMPATFCGREFSGLLPGKDVAFCAGTGVDGKSSLQLHEVYDDQGDFAFNSLRIRQPFDFTGRTGTIVFDVDAKVNPFAEGHGWWIELFVTEDPAPMPYHEAPGVLSFPRNGIGFAFMGCDGRMKNANAVTRVFVTKNHRILHDLPGWDLPVDECFEARDARMNRLKFLISKDTAEVFASDASNPQKLKRIARATDLGLPFSRGYVHIQHSQYNAHKDGDVTPAQTYRWDNVGFDGPVLPRPRAYEFPDNTAPDIDGDGGVHYGYYLTDKGFQKLSVEGVDLAGATRARLNLSFFAAPGRVLEYRFNGKAVRRYKVPAYDDGEHQLQAVSTDVPLVDLVPGTNLLELKVSAPQTYVHEAVANLDLTLEVAK
jgi:hypothetical protein